MGKCFITKLPSSVDNDNLPVLGQFKFNWLKQSTLPDNDARAIGLATNDTITVKVSGAHFTDSTLSANNGNAKTIKSTDGLVWLYVSNDADAVLTIDGKYSLTNINFVKPNKEGLVRSVYFDIEEIKYLTALTLLNLHHTQVSGDISAVSKLVNLQRLDFYHTQVSGDISVVSKLVNLQHLDFYYTQVSGDISAVSKLVNLQNLSLYGTQVSGDISAVSKLVNLQAYLSLSNTHVSGDISAVSKLVNLQNLSLYGTQVSGDISAVSKLVNLQALYLKSTQVSGDVDNLVGLTKLGSLLIDGTSLTGDMSKIPVNVRFISQSGRKITTNFTWTAKGRQNAKLLALEGPVPFDTVSMDNMLIDQATCTFNPSTSMPLYNVIAVSGVRTSASDAAVATIQSKGVTITGVTKQA